MKKVLSLLLTLVMLTGCSSDKEISQKEIDNLNKQKQDIQEEIDYILNNLEELKKDNGIKNYIVTLKIYQSHFTLDISEHLKDSMNAIEIQIPVSKQYYDSLEIGDLISDEFRMGSLILKGSIGNWNIKVIDKVVEE